MRQESLPEHNVLRWLMELRAEIALQDALEAAAMLGVISWSTADHVCRNIEVRQGIRCPGMCPDDDPELQRLRRAVVVAVVEHRSKLEESRPLSSHPAPRRPRRLATDFGVVLRGMGDA